MPDLAAQRHVRYTAECELCGAQKMERCFNKATGREYATFMHRARWLLAKAIDEWEKEK